MEFRKKYSKKVHHGKRKRHLHKRRLIQQGYLFRLHVNLPFQYQNAKKEKNLFFF